MKKTLRKVNEWKEEILTHKEIIFLSVFLLVLAVVINYNAGKYTSRVGSAIVNDFVLDNIAPVDLTFIFVYGWMLIVAALFAYPLFFKVHKIHEVISHFSLLIIVRSFFITLTHLKTPLDAIGVSFPGALSLLAFQNDLFFSGHTAVPFLGFLLFKGEKIRMFFLLGSIILAVTVLLMHQHYAIDVLSAYFITFGTYKMGKILFASMEKKR